MTISNVGKGEIKVNWFRSSKSNFHIMNTNLTCDSYSDSYNDVELEVPN